jgi:hypothetical protein
MRAKIQVPRLENAFGVAKVRVQSSTGTMMERISSGENLIGYNVLGSYALVRAKTDPSIGVVLPKDYTLVMSRVFFINKAPRTSTPPSCGWTTCCRTVARPSSPTTPSCSPSAPT